MTGISAVLSTSLIQVSDYVPLASTMVSAWSLFNEVIHWREEVVGKTTHVFKKLQPDEKWFFRKIVLLVPVLGNVSVMLYDVGKTVLSYIAMMKKRQEEVDRIKGLEADPSTEAESKLVEIIKSGAEFSPVAALSLISRKIIHNIDVDLEAILLSARLLLRESNEANEQCLKKLLRTLPMVEDRRVEDFLVNGVLEANERFAPLVIDLLMVRQNIYKIKISLEGCVKILERTEELSDSKGFFWRDFIYREMVSIVSQGRESSELEKMFFDVVGKKGPWTILMASVMAKKQAEKLLKEEVDVSMLEQILSCFDGVQNPAMSEINHLFRVLSDNVKKENEILLDQVMVRHEVCAHAAASALQSRHLKYRNVSSAVRLRATEVCKASAPSIFFWPSFDYVPFLSTVASIVALLGRVLVRQKAPEKTKVHAFKKQPSDPWWYLRKTVLLFPILGNATVMLCDAFRPLTEEERKRKKLVEIRMLGWAALRESNVEARLVGLMKRGGDLAVHAANAMADSVCSGGLKWKDLNSLFLAAKTIHRAQLELTLYDKEGRQLLAIYNQLVPVVDDRVELFFVDEMMESIGEKMDTSGRGRGFSFTALAMMQLITRQVSHKINLRFETLYKMIDAAEKESFIGTMIAVFRYVGANRGKEGEAFLASIMDRRWRKIAVLAAEVIVQLEKKGIPLDQKNVAKARELLQPVLAT